MYSHSIYYSILQYITVYYSILQCLQASYRSCTGKGVGRQGAGSFCKHLLCFSTTPCHPMPSHVQLRRANFSYIIYPYCHPRP